MEHITLPEESKILMTRKETMKTKNAFIEWSKHFVKFKSSGNTLLILGVIGVAEQHDTTELCLPSNTIHYTDTEYWL